MYFQSSINRDSDPPEYGKNGKGTAKVSGRLQVVRVTELREATRWSPRARAKTLILAVNGATVRLITIRSPLRLRPLPGKGCEFCNQPFNRAQDTPS